ncbi:hypothetical protein [Bacillus pseudomycoides]|uniref:hypothetical protein n=1 Tax=Bacillus pseudomycoides TaxID=64104 RepID=UPI001FB4E6EA|nr:hypothetical protein [Bacillus pseudomycoides]
MNNCKNNGLSAVPCPVPQTSVTPILQGPPGPPGPGAIESAFRANKTTVQPITAITVETVIFEDELFDFNNEYDGSTTFVPKQEGVYQINSNIVFAPNTGDSYFVRFNMVINGVVVATDLSSNNIATTSFTLATIYGLNPGDNVNIQIFSSVGGTAAFLTGQESSSFSAARFPFTSPIP